MGYTRQNNWNKDQGTRPQWKGNFGSGTFGSGTKRPVKTFQDLDVYQQALAASCSVSSIVLSFDKLVPTSPKRKEPKQIGILENGLNIVRETIIKNMLPCAFGIPHLMAEAHSLRFGAQEDCVVLLEKLMVNCNKMVVYLEQTRDICKTDMPWEFFDELIKKYMLIRRKALNLQRVWQKYMERPAAEIARPSGSQPPRPNF